MSPIGEVLPVAHKNIALSGDRDVLTPPPGSDDLSKGHGQFFRMHGKVDAKATKQDGLEYPMFEHANLKSLFLFIKIMPISSFLVDDGFEKILMR